MEALTRVGVRKTLPTKSHLFWAGNQMRHLWFVESGLVRAYRILEGEDYTFFFFPKGQFAVDFESYLTGQVSPLFLETLFPTEVWEFAKVDLYTLYQQHPAMERLGRLMAERAYLSATQRLKQHQTASLESRYKALIDQAPELFQQVPQYHIASYLGVKPQSLSRLKARMAGRTYGG